MNLRSAIPAFNQSSIAAEVSNHAEALTLQMVGWHRRVLEIGSGLTRALIAQGCKLTTVDRDPEAVSDLRGIAADVVVGDVDDPGTLARLAPDFEVAIAGRVFTSVADPQALLNRMAELIAPAGRIVLALPNVAHADIQLARLQGRFDRSGAPDRPQVPPFTLQEIQEMAGRAGLAITELLRVRIPAFETGLGIDRLTVSTATLNQVLAEPEAETHQFVFTAVRDDADRQIARLSSRCGQMQADAERQLVAAASRAIEIEALKRELEAVRAELQRQTIGSAEAVRQVETLAAELQEWRTAATQSAEALRDSTERSRQMHDTLAAEQARRAAAEAELAALRATRLFRYSKWPRAIYAVLRAARR